MNKTPEEMIENKIDFVIAMWKNPSNQMDGLHTLTTLKNDIKEIFTQCQADNAGRKWISTLTEKPPYGLGVLIAMKNGFITTAYRKKTTPNITTWFVYHDNLKLEDVVITHWMRLPELPNKN